MALYFRTEHRKNFPPMIVALRLVIGDDGKRTQKLIGSFNNINDAERINGIVKKLTKEERYEFDNFISILRFSERTFHADAQALDYRFMLRAPSKYKSALVKLWDEAKDYGINFVPENEMSTHLLDRAKIVEQYLKVLSDDKFSALSHLDVPLTKEDDAYPDTDSRRLLEAALDCTGSPDALADEFNYFCKQFKKRATFKPHYFAFLVNPSQSYTIKLWYYSIALEILIKHGKKPEHYVSIPIMVEHWLRFHEQPTLERTIKEFDQAFPKITKHEFCHNVIKRHFLVADLRKIGDFSDSTKEPSPYWAIERWIRKWKKSCRDGTAKNAIVEFKKQFPQYGNNVYFKQLIEARFS